RPLMVMLFHRDAEKSRLNSEFEFHLEQQAAEYVSQGMRPEEARLAAIRLLYAAAHAGILIDGYFGHGAGYRRDDITVHHRAFRLAAAVTVSRAGQAGDAL